MTYEQIIQKAGKRIVPRVYYYVNGVETSLNRDDFQQAKFKFNASLVGTVMSGVELEVKKVLPNTEIYIEITAKYDSYTQKKVYGGYLRRSDPTYNADAKTYTYEMYDKIITAMVDYKPIGITYPTTVYNFFKRLITELGFTTDITSLPNGSKTIEKDIYDGINYTYRDVLNDIGQATGTLFIIEESKIKKCSFGTSTKTINDDILKNQNITLGKHFGPINTIVLTRSGDSDSIYHPKTLPDNPIEFRIADNQLMNENDREDYLADIYNQLKGIEFDIYDTALVGYGGFAPLSKIKISTNGKEYNSYVFNNEITISQGYEEVIYTEMPEESATDYKASDTTDRKVNQVYIIARKLEKEIVAVVDTTNKIAKEVNPTKTVNGSNIYLDDASNNELMSLQIEGKSEQETRSGYNLVGLSNGINTLNGITYTITDNGKIILNGTSTAITKIYFPLLKSFNSVAGEDYTLQAFNPITYTGIEGNLRIRFTDNALNEYGLLNITTINSNVTTILDTKADITITNLMIRLENGITLNNFEIKPQSFLGRDTSKPYEQYGVSPSPDYPSEIKSVGYENLFDINSITENYLYEDGGVFTPAMTYNTSDYILCKSNEFIVSAKFTTYNPYIRYIVAEFDENKTYIQRQLNADSSSPKYTFTLNSNTKYIRLCYRNDATLYDIQLEKGSIAHPYISYGKYGIEVKTVGKNIFKPTLTADDGNKIQIANGTVELNDDVFKLTATDVDLYFGQVGVTGNKYNGTLGNLIDVSNYDSISFALSNNSFTRNLLTCYDENLISLGYYQQRSSKNTIPASSFPTGTKYITFRFGVNPATVGETYETTVQIEKGDIITEYQPYQERISTIVLNEPLRSLPNGVKDIAYIRNNKLYVDRYVGSLILNGSENWYFNKMVNNYGYYTAIRDAKAVDNTTMSANNILCSHYKVTRPDWQWNSVVGSINCALNTGQPTVRFTNGETTNELATFKTWLSTHNTQVDYELATPVTEEYGEIEILETLKGFNHIFVVDKLEPIMNIEYVRDTVISNYVENHISTIKIAEGEIIESVEKVSSSVNGLGSTIEKVEEKTTSNEKSINIISTNIDATTGEVREVTTTTGFTFNADGMQISDGSGFVAQHTANGTYYKDGDVITGQYTKDGSKQKDLELFGIYTYGKNDINDTAMFIAQLFTDENGEECFGHFYNK